MRFPQESRLEDPETCSLCGDDPRPLVSFNDLCQECLDFYDSWEIRGFIRKAKGEREQA